MITVVNIFCIGVKYSVVLCFYSLSYGRYGGVSSLTNKSVASWLVAILQCAQQFYVINLIMQLVWVHIF